VTPLDLLRSPRPTRLALGATLLVAAATLSVSDSATGVHAQRRTPTPVFGYKVVNAYPHDSEAYTQGLIYRGGFLYESTGLNGRSTLRKVKLETG
jgi:glutaminyl-peptide cyclotransferase